jgi:hypothetical protein
MRIAVAPTRLIADALEGVTRLIRGVSRIPSAFAERVGRAHAEADADELARQRAALEALKLHAPPARARIAPHAPEGRESPEAGPAPEEERAAEEKAARAVAEIQAVLQKYKARGLDAYVILGREGKPVIVVGTPPGSEQQVLDAIEESRGLLNESPGADR